MDDMTKKPTIKLYFYPNVGRAEIIRWMLAYAGQEFQDIRINIGSYDLLRTAIARSPFHNVPFIEYDGKPLGESLAIIRFLAHKFGLDGKDEWESAQAESIAEYVWELFDKYLVEIKMERDAQKQGNLKRQFHTEGALPYLNTINRILQSNDNGAGFLVGTGLTIADCAVPFLLNILSSSELAKYPLLKAYNERFHNLPGIKQWLAKYPPENWAYRQIPY